MLLRTRSILAQASLLVVVGLVKSQNYDSDYHVSDGEGDDSSSYTGEAPASVDYSKYYSVDGGAPASAQIQGRSDGGGGGGGFVAPIEFSSFFGSPQFAFGASNNQEILKPLLSEVKKEDGGASGFVNDKDFKGGFAEYNADGFGVQDYFEQAQKQEKAEAEEDDEEGAEQKPGPSYISHRLPARKHKSKNYEAEVEELREKPSNYESQRVKNPESEQIDEVDSEDFKPSAPLNLAQFQPSNPSKLLLDVDTVGKLSHLPYSPEPYQQFAKVPPAKPSPYQKYSFQPAASTFGLKEASILNAFQSTSAPFNPTYSKLPATAATNYEYQPSETVSQNLKNKDCIRVSKEISDQSGKFTKQPMNCFVCKDPKTGGKYEQCSYTNEPTPKSYYQSTSQSFGNPEGYRNKRDESKSFADPYEEIKAKSHAYYSKPEDFEKDYYRAPDLSKISEEYNYSPDTFNDKEAEEKSYSEIQSEELVKKGDNCHKTNKNGVTCTVCKNAKTGANYEQCSYESAPNEKKYAYVKESKFDGDGNPVDEKEPGNANSEAVVNDDKERYTESSGPSGSSADESEDEVEETRTSEERNEERPKISRLINDEPYDVPRHFAETTYKQQKAGVRGLDPELYGSADEASEKSEETDRGPQKFSNLDEYHLKLFPQFANQETKREEQRAKPEGDNSYFEELSGKKDVEKVLEEFTKKDRSNCKQIRKKGMTCYLCVDKKGIQQEECMYVSESRPQSSHVAYHEVQHLKSPEKQNISEPEQEENSEEASASEIQKKKKFFKKASSVVPEDSEANASTNVETRIKYTPEAAAAPSNKNKRYTKKQNARDTKQKRSKPDKQKLDDSQDPKPQFDVADEGGLYAAETKPVYSKALGLSLPRYMLETSELEQEFDRSVSGE